MMKTIIGLDDFPDRESAEQENGRAAEIRYSLEYGTLNEHDPGERYGRPQATEQCHCYIDSLCSVVPVAERA
jgi:hypothetical protein